jgi:hypothetical protein
MIGGMLLGPVVALALGNLGVDDGLQMWDGLPWARVGAAGLLVGLGSRVSTWVWGGSMLTNSSDQDVQVVISYVVFLDSRPGL